MNLASHVDQYRIDLPAGTRLTELSLRVTTSHKGPFACLAELDVVPAE